MHHSFPLKGTKHWCVGLKMQALRVFLRKKKSWMFTRKTVKLYFPWWFHLPLETDYSTYHQWPIIQIKLLSRLCVVKQLFVTNKYIFATFFLYISA